MTTTRDLVKKELPRKLECQILFIYFGRIRSSILDNLIYLFEITVIPSFHNLVDVKEKREKNAQPLGFR